MTEITDQTIDREPLPSGFITTQEASELIGLSTKRVTQLIAEQVLEAKKVGRKWWISRKSVDEYVGLSPDQTNSRANIRSCGN